MLNERVIVVALLLAIGMAAPAQATNAEAALDVGDKIYGHIRTAGEVDRLTFTAPRDAELKFTLIAIDSGLGLSLALYPPDAPTVEEPVASWLSGSPSKVKLKGFPLRVSGAWVLEVRAAPGTTGHYKLKTSIAYRGKWKSVDPIGASTEAEIPFAAPSGSRLKLKIKVADGDVDPAVSRLETPAGAQALPADLSQSDVALGQTGEYAVVVTNAAAVPGSLKAKLTVKAPSTSGRSLWLSPDGFGPAPTVDSADPSSGLQGGLIEDIVIDGEGFDPAAIVYLRRSGQADAAAEDVVVVSGTRITCSLDLGGLKPGTWALTVENPSGGSDSAKFKVKDPGGVKLPLGVLSDTEVWYIEFAEEFDDDLALFGLSSTSDKVAKMASDAVKAYVIYDLREMFGARGSDGKVRTGAVPVSFVVDEPSSLVGAPGETYNRLRIGGEILPGEPAGDNANVAWGLTEVDTGNTRFDDLSRDGGPGRGLFLRALNPFGTSVTPAWRTDFVALLVTPLTVTDEQYFGTRFDPVTSQEGVRYATIDGSIRTVAREVAAVAAHHIARAMGLSNGTTGISSTPAAVGTFAAQSFPEFLASELTTLATNVRESHLPGSSKTLEATYLPLRGIAEYLLPEVQTAVPTIIDLPFAGGRPDLRVDDVEYQGLSGYLPIGFDIDQQQVGGTAPFTVTGAWYYAAFGFTVRIRDDVSGDEDRPQHRINLVINLALVPAAQQAQAEAFNAQVRAAR